MIQFEKIGAIGKITLNRPDKYNAFVRGMALELQKKLDECSSDETIRCIIISGSGKAFCAGQDLKEAIDPSYYNSGEVTVGFSEIEMHHRPNPLLNYYLRTGIKAGVQKSQFLRFHMQANIYYKFTKKMKTKLRIWAGGFINKKIFLNST